MSILILAASRTPVALFGKAFAKISAPTLGSIAIKSALEKAKVSPSKIDEVLMGNVLSANIGQSPARQAAIGAGLLYSTDATTINKVCASGLKAVTLAAVLLKSGGRNCVVAGGMESMSNVPLYFKRGHNYGNTEVLDGIVKDGLTDAFDNIHMGVCAEETATKHNITREQQDAHAIQSYKRSKAAWQSGHFTNEIAPVLIKDKKKGDRIISEDEEYLNIKFDKVPLLNPAFVKGGTVTAANSSTLNDGASALILSTAKFAKENNAIAIAEILGFADAATNPREFTIAPSLAIPLALDNAGNIALKDVALFEINEAFSAVALVNEKILGLDPDRVNVNGGAVALGHPLGSSGSRILVTLVHALKKGEIGVAAICNGGGAATACVIRKLI